MVPSEVVVFETVPVYVVVIFGETEKVVGAVPALPIVGEIDPESAFDVAQSSAAFCPARIELGVRLIEHAGKPPMLTVAADVTAYPAEFVTRYE